MSVQARTRPLVGKYAFTVHDLSYGIQQAKFSKCTGIKMTISIATHYEGGALAPMKEGTTVEYGDATLEHGVFENKEIWTWVKEMVNMMASSPEGQGVASPNQLRNVIVRQKRRDRTVLRSLPLYNCQPADFTPGDFDNSSKDIQVETLTMAYEYFDLK